MAVKREIEIQIKSDGQVSLTVRGVRGKECIEFSRFLEESLGEEISRELTSEYYIEETSAEEKLKKKESL
jgi:hypothetical protein